MKSRWLSLTVALIAVLSLGTAYAASTTLQIERFVYDGKTPTDEGDEYVKICNVSASTIDLSGYKIGDEETKGSGEGMYSLPAESLVPDGCIIVAKNANQFNTRYGFLPNYEIVVTGGGMTDNLSVPNLSQYTAWGTGSWALSNSGDELLLLSPTDALVDGICFEGGTNNFNATGAGTLVTDACTSLNVGDGVGLKRGSNTDTDTTTDFSGTPPNAITLNALTAASAPVAAALPALGLAALGGLALYRRRRA